MTQIHASYLPLARKYRPATFAELVGQDATSIALANAIKLGREPHAVIFSGVRGVGKTTSARLYAKALNCEVNKSAEPCNGCESCDAINRGVHEDVMEIDGASNTGVDDVRALRETVAYVPQRSRFKVYIIDEVHMLSQSAFNALLKTLEEPPPHVVFIFATTELQKIPQTIMSRCQLFHLQRLGLSTIRDRLAHILDAEKIPYEEKAIAAIAREGHGSMRDALTLLDHVIAVGSGNVSAAALGKIITHISSTHFLTLLEALVKRDARSIIATLDILEESGIDLRDGAESLATITRHAMILRDVSADLLDLKTLGLDDEEARKLREIGKSAGASDLNRVFRTIVKARTELDGSSLDRFILENYCLEWCMDPGISFDFSAPVRPSAASRPASQPAISAAPATAAAPPASPPTQMASANSTPATAQNQAKSIAQIKDQLQQKPGATASGARELPPTWRECVDAWKKLNPLQAKRLEDVHPVQYGPSLIELVVPTESYFSAMLLKPEELAKTKDTFRDIFGFTGNLVVTAKKQAAVAATPNEEQAAQLPDTVGSIQKREKEQRQDALIQDAKSHPVTQEAIKLFTASIESINPRS
jgi:DNA polymerase-3 subunit gamma/tau